MITAARIQPHQLVPAVSAGLVIGVQRVVVAISFATLLFSGPLAVDLARGIGLALFGIVIVCGLVALTSSFPASIAGPVSNSVVILALITATIAGTKPTEGSVFPTVVAAIALSSCLMGALFLILGWFRLGNLIRFLPYPVMGGFMATTGWLLVQGSFMAMGVSLDIKQLAALEFDDVARLLSGVGFGILLLLALRRYNYYFVMPGLLVCGIAVLDALLSAGILIVPEFDARGWFLGPFPQGALWQPPSPAWLAQVDWETLAAQADKLGTMLIIGVISMLLNATGIEVAIRKDIDLNRELMAAGIANLVAGLGGGLMGYQTTSVSVLAHKMGGYGRVAGLVAGALCGLVLVGGSSLLTFFPKPVLGGLLFYLGLTILVDWMYNAYFKLPRADYVLVLVIWAVGVTVGFLESIAAGVAIAIGLFVAQYSRIQVVRHTLTGASFHSTMDRPPSQRQFLREQGSQLEVLQLQGFLFFGTAQTLLDRIRLRMDARDLPHLRFLVLDFARVNGLDSSAASSFVKLDQLAETNQLQLVLTGLSSEMQCQSERGGLSQDHNVRWMPTVDAGVEWCEDQILMTGSPDTPVADDLPAQFAQVFPRSQDVGRILSYFQKEQADANQWLMRQGDPADTLYFIGDGLATAQLELPDGRTVRLRTMRCGTTIGEVGLYLGTTRTASVRTEQPSTLYRLSADAVRQMEMRDPDLAAALHKWVARLMAERLAENNTTLAAMLD